MTGSEKSHQNRSDYTQFLFLKRFKFNKKKDYFYQKMRVDIINQVIINIIMLTRSTEMIFNPSHYTSNG